MSYTKVLIINNAEEGVSKYFAPIEVILTEERIIADTIEYSEIPKADLDEYDAIILSASPCANNIVDHHLPYYHWVKTYNKPLLGICAGHHIVGKLFGSYLRKNVESEIGKYYVTIDEADQLFDGYKERFLVRQNHKDSITLPDDFTLLAHSDTCKVQVMRHKKRPIYTTQFHAEISNKKLISNFLNMIKPSRCLPRGTRFSEYFLSCNGLNKNRFREWAFYPGMLFHSTENWWGNGGKRDKPHEGLDLCFYRDKDGKNHCFTTTIKVPVIYKGRVVKIIDDFISKSIFVSHDIYDSKGNQLYTIYGHVEPYEGIIRGTVLEEGAIIATITDAKKKKAKMSSHLHISVAWIPESLHSESLNWKTLNNSSIVTLLDPLNLISCNYSILPYQNNTKMS